MDRPGDEDRCGEDASMLEESYFTPKGIQLLQYWYKNGYKLYAGSDCIAWLIKNNSENVPDEILVEIGGELDQSQSDPFQPFESEFTTFPPTPPPVALL